MGVSVKNLSKSYVSSDILHAAVRNVSFNVEEGALVALLGPSGSGKSTILRLIAGLELPDMGGIHLGGEDVSGLPIQKRGVGFVFQSYALFRHLTVFDNIAFGLEVKKASKQKISARVEELLKLFGLVGLEHRYPHQLSGGQRQRVALARALAPSPKVLLLDEPFGAIDAKNRQELRDWLRKLHDEVHVTSIFVTHDQEEALEICDRIFIINQGRIEQEGTPEEIYNHPATEFVANFVGSMNIYTSEVKDGKLQIGPYVFGKNAFNGFEEGEKIRFFFRPQDIYVSSSLKSYALHGTILRCSFLGVNLKLEILTEDGFNFFAIIPQHIYYREKLHEGAQISYQIEELRYVSLKTGSEIKKLVIGDYEI